MVLRNGAKPLLNDFVCEADLFVEGLLRLGLVFLLFFLVLSCLFTHSNTLILILILNYKH